MTWNDIEKVSGTNLAARDCLASWAACLRAVDDIVDNRTYDETSIINALALNIKFCSDPFYRSHVQALQAPALISTALWVVSVGWEDHNIHWKQEWADVLRHADVVFLSAICLICKGWTATEPFAREFLEAAHEDHKKRHDKT